MRGGAHRAAAQRKAGFSLVELMFAVFIFTMFIAGVGSLMVFASKSIAQTSAKSLAESNMQKWATRMGIDVKDADWLSVYDSYSGSPTAILPSANPASAGVGDFLLLAYFKDATGGGSIRANIPRNESQLEVARVVGYYIDDSQKDSDGYAPIYRVAYDYPAGGAARSAEADLTSLLPGDLVTNGSQELLVDKARPNIPADTAVGPFHYVNAARGLVRVGFRLKAQNSGDSREQDAAFLCTVKAR